MAKSSYTGVNSYATDGNTNFRYITGYGVNSSGNGLRTRNLRLGGSAEIQYRLIGADDGSGKAYEIPSAILIGVSGTQVTSVTLLTPTNTWVGEGSGKSPLPGSIIINGARYTVNRVERSTVNFRCTYSGRTVTKNNHSRITFTAPDTLADIGSSFDNINLQFTKGESDNEIYDTAKNRDSSYEGLPNYTSGNRIYRYIAGPGISMDGDGLISDAYMGGTGPEKFGLSRGGVAVPSGIIVYLPDGNTIGSLTFYTKRMTWTTDGGTLAPPGSIVVNGIRMTQIRSSVWNAPFKFTVGSDSETVIGSTGVGLVEYAVNASRSGGPVIGPDFNPVNLQFVGGTDDNSLYLPALREEEEPPPEPLIDAKFTGPECDTKQFISHLVSGEYNDGATRSEKRIYPHGITEDNLLLLSHHLAPRRFVLLNSAVDISDFDGTKVLPTAPNHGNSVFTVGDWFKCVMPIPNSQLEFFTIAQDLNNTRNLLVRSYRRGEGAVAAAGSVPALVIPNALPEDTVINTARGTAWFNHDAGHMIFIYKKDNATETVIWQIDFNPENSPALTATQKTNADFNNVFDRYFYNPYTVYTNSGVVFTYSTQTDTLAFSSSGAAILLYKNGKYEIVCQTKNLTKLFPGAPDELASNDLGGLAAKDGKVYVLHNNGSTAPGNERIRTYLDEFAFTPDPPVPTLLTPSELSQDRDKGRIKFLDLWARPERAIESGNHGGNPPPVLALDKINEPLKGGGFFDQVGAYSLSNFPPNFKGDTELKRYVVVIKNARITQRPLAVNNFELFLGNALRDGESGAGHVETPERMIDEVIPFWPVFKDGSYRHIASAGFGLGNRSGGPSGTDHETMLVRITPFVFTDEKEFDIVFSFLATSFNAVTFQVNGVGTLCDGFSLGVVEHELSGHPEIVGPRIGQGQKVTKAKDGNMNVEKQDDFPSFIQLNFKNYLEVSDAHYMRRLFESSTPRILFLNGLMARAFTLPGHGPTEFFKVNTEGPLSFKLGPNYESPFNMVTKFSAAV